jgi:hypothetical protein
MRRARVVPRLTKAHLRRWQSKSAEDNAAYLHEMYARHREAYLPKYMSRAISYGYPRNKFVLTWRWFFGDVVAQGFKLLRRNGTFVRETSGVTKRRQAIDLLTLSLTMPTMPENYYKFELYRPENRSRAEKYLHRHETKGVLFRMLTDITNLDSVSPLTDKAAFVKHAEAADLSVTPVYAVVEPNRAMTTIDDLPQHDLFVKPLTGRGGSGAQVWAYDGSADQFRLLGKDKLASRDKLLKKLAKRSKGRTLIVQPRLSNHPDITDLALDAVPTCRMITFTNESGEGEPVIAVFRMPAVPDKVVDNIHAGGVAAPIDLTTGVGGLATYRALRAFKPHSRHPQSGPQTVGGAVPLWFFLLKLATRAHETFAPRVIAGWDISIGPTGPVLVEGNAQPCVDLLQRPHDMPLGSHRFGGLMAFHIRRQFDGEE